MINESMKEQVWLAELDRYGNPKLIDGSHYYVDDAKHAHVIYKHLAKTAPWLMPEGKTYAVVKVTILEELE